MADFFTWDPNQLGLNVKDMDDEHIELIKKMNNLHAAHTRNAPTAEIEKILMDFATYTTKHFSDEEAYMEKVKYEGLDTHKIIHKQLLDQVGTYVGEFKKSGKLTDQFFKFLSVWLTSHIRGIDMKYSPKVLGRAA